MSVRHMAVLCPAPISPRFGGVKFSGHKHNGTFIRPDVRMPTARLSHNVIDSPFNEKFLQYRSWNFLKRTFW